MGAPKEAPHIRVAPAEDGVDAHEGRVVLIAGTESVLTLSIRIAPAHDARFRHSSCQRKRHSVLQTLAKLMHTGNRSNQCNACQPMQG